MDWVLGLLLFLHIGGAILAFGPTYAFLLLGPMAGAERQHLNFALRVQKQIASTFVVPFALFQGVTGLLLVWRLGFELLGRGWLLLGIALYLVALAIAFGILLPALGVLIPATSGPPPAPPAPGTAPVGPPPHIAAAARRARLGGMINSLLILVIVFLMVTKPF
ncbi:MAG TPA: DUF2269 family protein [Candidatus Limnocylindrales bacterium]|nr:DUF2269 family protein [Candidatus Limnocylindrales bacterium]